MRRDLIQRVVVITAAVGLLIATSSGVASAASRTDVSSKKTACTGQPVKMMSISGLTGPTALPEVSAGVEAAVKAVNATCAAGRPIDVTICDDGSDINKGQACARKAVDGNYVAKISSISAVNNSTLAITSAAGIPDFGNSAAGAAELTDPTSFPLGGGALAALLGEAATIAAAGAKTMTLVAPDVPQIQAFSAVLKDHAAKLKVDLQRTVLIPGDVTDYAQFAAQAQGTDGIAVLLGNTGNTAFIRALIDAGTNFKKTIVTAGSGLTQKLVNGLGSRVNGLYIGYSALPNGAGGKQYLKESAAIGKKNVAVPGGAGQLAWRAVHLMAEDVIPKLKTVDAASILAFLKTASFNTPDLGSIDFTKPAYPDDPTLAKLRVFTNKFVPARIVGGRIVPASDGLVAVDESFRLVR